MKNKKLNTLIKISLLSVMAFLLMFLEMPLPMFPDFLKIDISDLPALLGSFALGPVAAVGIELFKNILHILLKGSSTVFIGESANFLVGGILVFTAGVIYKKNKTKVNAIIALAVGIAVMSLAAGILNYYAFLPLYEKVLGIPMAAIIGAGSKVNHYITSLATLIIWAIIPFNLLKGAVLMLITIPVYKKVSPILHKEELYNREGSKLYKKEA